MPFAAPGPAAPVLRRFVEVPGRATGAAEVEAEDRRELEAYEGAGFARRDLEFTSFVSCTFRRASLDAARLRGASFTECVLADVDATELAAPRTQWSRVRVEASRFGSAELYDTSWRSVLVEGSKIDYLNARGATWSDVVFRDCVLEELDLGGAKVERLSLEGCRVGTLSVAGARLHDVDLRHADVRVITGLAGLAGAWITESQLADLAPALAAALGVRIVE